MALHRWRLLASPWGGVLDLSEERMEGGSWLEHRSDVEVPTHPPDLLTNTSYIREMDSGWPLLFPFPILLTIQWLQYPQSLFSTHLRKHRREFIFCLIFCAQLKDTTLVIRIIKFSLIRYSNVNVIDRGVRLIKVTPQFHFLPVDSAVITSTLSLYICKRVEYLHCFMEFIVHHTIMFIQLGNPPIFNMGDLAD